MPKKYTYIKPAESSSIGLEDPSEVYAKTPENVSVVLGTLFKEHNLTCGFIPAGGVLYKKDLLSIVHHMKKMEEYYQNDAYYNNNAQVDSYSDEDCVSHN